MTVPKTTALEALPTNLIDRLLADYTKPEDLIDEDGLLKQITKTLVERALLAEFVEHLGNGKHAPVEKPLATPATVAARRRWRAPRQGTPPVHAARET